MPLIDPSTILVPPDRQRGRTTPDKPIDTSDLEQSLAAIGQIQPIVVRNDGDSLILVAGFRRLEACRRLDRPVEYRLWADLTPDEARIIELEENAKRQDLPWRESVIAIGELHAHWLKQDDSWSVDRTAQRISLHFTKVYENLFVYRHLDSELLRDAQNLTHAHSILQRASDRRAAAIVEELSRSAATTFTPPPTNGQGSTANAPSIPLHHLPSSADPNAILPPGPAVADATLSTSPPTAPAVVAPPPPPPPAPVVLCTDFLSWAPTYTGPKFNLIHCDFPYGVGYEAFANSVAQRGELYASTEDIYWKLLASFAEHLDRFVSYSAHIVFWFHMNLYDKTRKALEAMGLFVHRRPLIWHKTDNSGIVPGANAQYFRWIYETAFLCSRGRRPVIKAVGDAYGAPIAAGASHPTVKPEPMLRHFFSGLIDETTDVFDPTCGSGAALRAAESVGARSVLGLEINPEFATTANAATLRARQLRLASRAI